MRAHEYIAHKKMIQHHSPQISPQNHRNPAY